MRLCLIISLLTLNFHFSSFSQTTWCVKASATGANNGFNWDDAFTSLQSALDAAQPGDNIWVAAGTYYPEKSIDAYDTDARLRSFLLPGGVAIYGGFAGNEPANTDLSQRNFSLNRTILSGDVDHNDVLNQGISTSLQGENVFHVVTVVSATPTAFDGFTITGGKADGTIPILVAGITIPSWTGGGICIYESNFTASNIVVDGNIAVSGGGIYCRVSQMNITNVLVQNNQATGNGGGICCVNSQVVIHQAELVNNESEGLGGRLCSSQGTYRYTNAVFRNNKAAYGGGGGYDFQATVILVNSLITGNETEQNGGGWFSESDYNLFVNITITNNRSGLAGGGFISIYSHRVINSIINGNESPEHPEMSALTNEFRCVIAGSGFYNHTGALIPNYVRGPLLRDPASGDFSLSPASVAINAGNNQLFQDATGGAVNIDIAGTTRIMATIIDLGAYECTIRPDANGILYVNANASTQEQTGESWGQPLKELADALAFARRIDNSNVKDYIKEIWVAAGTYKPLYRIAEPTTDRDKTFWAVGGIHLYGGFAATQGSEGDRNARNWITNPTILDGDIDGDGTPANNVHHVVVGPGFTSDSTVFDGFTIRNGNADVSSLVVTDGFMIVHRDVGGGLYNFYGLLRLRNIRFENNRATRGGGFFTTGASELYGVTFHNNEASDYGGGMVTNNGNVQVYPNPSPGAFKVALAGWKGRVQLQLINAAGNVVHTQTIAVSDDAITISVQPKLKLSPGVYMLKITGEHFNRQIKLIVQ